MRHTPHHPANDLEVTDDLITLTERHRPFPKWTDDEIRNRAKTLQSRGAAVTVDASRPIVRIDATTVRVPAWIEMAPWD